MVTDYKNPHEMNPEEMLNTSERLSIRGDYGAAFYYATVAMSLEGVLMARNSNEDSWLKEFHERASFLMHHTRDHIDSNLANMVRPHGIALTNKNKLDLMKKYSPHFQRYEELLKRFEDQKILYDKVNNS
jgi:hypothetical protein